MWFRCVHFPSTFVLMITCIWHGGTRFLKIQLEWNLLVYSSFNFSTLLYLNVKKFILIQLVLCSYNAIILNAHFYHHISVSYQISGPSDNSLKKGKKETEKEIFPWSHTAFALQLHLLFHIKICYFLYFHFLFPHVWSKKLFFFLIGIVFQ